MPRLESLREKIEIKLPESGGTVWLWKFLLAGENELIEKAYTEGVKLKVDPATQKTEKFEMDFARYYQAVSKTLEIMIADWDFEDDSGKKAEITLDNIKKLPAADYKLLVAKADEIIATNRLDDTKKNLY